MADTLDVRIAHLEGAYEQIDRGLAELRREIYQREDTRLQQETRALFHWILGVQVLSCLSIMGTLLAFSFRR